MEMNKVFSVRHFTTVLVLSILVPLLLLIVGLLVDRHHFKEETVYKEVRISAKNIANNLDQELIRVQSGLELLADANELREKSRLSVFYESAKRAAQYQKIKNYVLTDRAGVQVLNTIVDFGTTLPVDGTPNEIAAVFEKKKVVITDLFVGALTKEFVVSIGVPVLNSHDEVIYSLNTGITPFQIQKIFLNLPSEWTGAVIDSRGVIVARSKDANKFVGKKAVNALQKAILTSPEGTLETKTKDDTVVLTGFSRSTVANWTVAIGAPKQKIVSATYNEVLIITCGCLFVVFVSFFISRKISYKIENAVYGLVGPANALSEGRTVVVDKFQIKEVNIVNEAILSAFHSLETKTYFANHDSLTGLPNRSLFNEILENNVILAKRKNKKIALLTIDLDGFKSINDTEGHPVGDTLLKGVAGRIKSALRESDTVARFGGDEFLVLLPDSDYSVSSTIAKDLIMTISEPYHGIKGRISASIGIAVFPDMGKNVADLMESSDKALYEAKAAGKGCFRPVLS